MCGRFSVRYTWSELHALYDAFLATTENDWSPKFNIAPTTQIPVLRANGGARRFDLMRWGLVPSWSKEIGKFATFNARSDGCTSKPTYRGAWKAGQRCIIPASSFFEWRKSDKQPFAIGMGNGGPMNFAGLWDVAQIDGGAMLSCTMITTDGNDLMAPIHDRMPVMIGDEDLAGWLGDVAPAQAVDMLKPFPAARMKVWEVAKDVGKVSNQGEHLVSPSAR